MMPQIEIYVMPAVAVVLWGSFSTVTAWTLEDAGKNPFWGWLIMIVPAICLFGVIGMCLPESLFGKRKDIQESVFGAGILFGLVAFHVGMLLLAAAFTLLVLAAAVFGILSILM